MGWPFLENVMVPQLEGAEEQARHRLAGDMYLHDAMKTIRGEVMDAHRLRSKLLTATELLRLRSSDGGARRHPVLPEDVLECRPGGQTEPRMFSESFGGGAVRCDS